MGLFGRDKKRNETSCCRGSSGAPVENTGATVKILGSGCAKCNQLEASVKTALGRLGLDEAVDHVTDFAEIAMYGVMSTPALVVKEKVVSVGKVLTVDEAVTLIRENMQG